ncbi:MAG: histidine kinase dimerization/phospho-acceptor domain-containing protein, partial [Phenylobacterium sp.]
MSEALRALARRWWPALRLRTILFLVLFFVAALPGLGAIFLRVYENTLVRQTEAELVAQGAALAAAAEVLWPGAPPAQVAALMPEDYRPERSAIDLSQTPILAERPAARPAPHPDPQALAAARALAQVSRRTARTTLAAVVLTDAQGRIVLGAEQGSYADLPEVRQALGGRPATVLRRNGSYYPRYRFEWLSRAAAVRIHHARPVIVQGRVAGVLLLSRSPRALFRGLYQDRVKILTGAGLILLALVVLSGLVSRGVSRPIEALSAASRKVAAGQGGDIPRTPATAAVEIRALYEDFAAMSEAIARRSRYLRDFAAAVSHEFKTPLAGLAGAAELLEDHGEAMTPEERRRFLDNIKADVARLSQLVSRLMDLARADMARPEAGAAIDPAPVLRRIADACATPGFAIEVDAPQALPAVAVPEAALETALTTLAVNARQAGAARLSLSAA